MAKKYAQYHELAIKQMMKAKMYYSPENFCLLLLL